MNTPKDPKIIFAITGVALFVCGGFLYLQNSGLDPMKDQVSQLSEKLKEQTKIDQKLDQSKSELTALKTQLAHVEEGIPDAAYIPTMLKELELSGKEMGIEVAGLRPAIKPPSSNNEKDIVKKPAYEPLDIEMKGKGSYTNLLKFISSLNTFPKIVQVRLLSITPQGMGSKGSDGRLDFTLGLRAFLFKQQPDAHKPVEGGSA